LEQEDYADDNRAEGSLYFGPLAALALQRSAKFGGKAVECRSRVRRLAYIVWHFGSLFRVSEDSKNADDGFVVWKEVSRQADIFRRAV